MCSGGQAEISTALGALCPPEGWVPRRAPPSQQRGPWGAPGCPRGRPGTQGTRARQGHSWAPSPARPRASPSLQTAVPGAAHWLCPPAGVFFSSGVRWRAARQLTVRTLHGLGVGRATVANKVLQELRCLTGQLDSYRGE